MHLLLHPLDQHQVWWHADYTRQRPKHFSSQGPTLPQDWCCAATYRPATSVCPDILPWLGTGCGGRPSFGSHLCPRNSLLRPSQCASTRQGQRDYHHTSPPHVPVQSVCKEVQDCWGSNWIGQLTSSGPENRLPEVRWFKTIQSTHHWWSCRHPSWWCHQCTRKSGYHHPTSRQQPTSDFGTAPSLLPSFLPTVISVWGGWISFGTYSETSPSPSSKAPVAKIKMSLNPHPLSSPSLADINGVDQETWGRLWSRLGGSDRPRA